MNTTPDKTLRHIGLTRERVMQLTAPYKSTAREADSSYFTGDKCVFPEELKAKIRELADCGENYKAIAKEVGCSKTSVYNVLKEGR